MAAVTDGREGVAVIWGLMVVAAIAALYVIVFGFLSSLAHMTFAVIRHWGGRESRFHWFIAWRSLPLILALLAVPLLLLIEHAVKNLGVVSSNLWSMALLALVFMAVVLPFFLPLMEAWRYHKTSSYVLSTASLISFPLIVGLMAALSADAMSDFHLDAPAGVFAAAPQLQTIPDRTYFEPSSDCGPCGKKIAAWLDLPDMTSPAGGWPGRAVDFNAHRWAFWFETAAEGVTFDALEVYHCHFSALSHNADSVVMSTLVFLFRILYPALFFATIAVLARGVWTKLRDGVRDHSR